MILRRTPVFVANGVSLEFVRSMGGRSVSWSGGGTIRDRCNCGRCQDVHAGPYSYKRQAYLFVHESILCPCRAYGAPWVPLIIARRATLVLAVGDRVNELGHHVPFRPMDFARIRRVHIRIALVGSDEV